MRTPSSAHTEEVRSRFPSRLSSNNRKGSCTFGIPAMGLPLTTRSGLSGISSSCHWGAPIIHVFLKKLKIPGLLLLVLGLFSIKSFPQGVLFYAIGAYLQMNRKNLLAVFSKIHVPCSIAALVCLVLLCVSFFEQGWWFQISQKGFILFGTLSTFHWADILVGNKEIERNAFLSRSSFFIFAAHGILILDDFAFYICLHLFNGSSLTVRMADLVCRAGLTILICLLLYYLTERFLPKTTRFLTGNRSSRLSHA